MSGLGAPRVGLARYLEAMARDKIGSSTEASDCSARLNNRIGIFSTATSAAGQNM